MRKCVECLIELYRHHLYLHLYLYLYIIYRSISSMFITHTQGGRTLKIWTQTLIIYRFCFSIFNQGIWALGSDENILGVSGSLGLPSPVSLLEYGWECGTQGGDLGGAWGVSKGGCWGCGSIRLTILLILCWSPDQKSSPLSEPDCFVAMETTVLVQTHSSYFLQK